MRVVHPSMPTNYQDYLATSGMPSNATDFAPKYKNALCDVDGLCAHIRAGHDIFVTRDEGMIRRRDALMALGANEILTPDDALARVLDESR